ncbi:MAG: TadE/TadG family type IV pilus assembly protein [Hyphomicrobiaceae bacterium]
MRAGLAVNWAQFAANERGNVAVIFAAVMIPVIAVVATALDYGRASKVRDQIAHAAEAAAQAASTNLDLDRDRLTKLVRTQLNANLPQDLKDLPFEMAIPSDKKSIEISLATEVPTSLMGLVGIPELSVGASGFSRRPLPKLPGDAEQPAIARSPEPSQGVRELWRSLFGGAGPDPEMMRHIQAEAEQAAARLRDAGVAIPSAPAAGMPDFGPIGSADDLRRAAQQLENQLRDLPQFGGGASPQDIERMMRDMRRMR